MYELLPYRVRRPFYPSSTKDVDRLGPCNRVPDKPSVGDYWRVIGKDRLIIVPLLPGVLVCQQAQSLQALLRRTRLRLPSILQRLRSSRSSRSSPFLEGKTFILFATRDAEQPYSGRRTNRRERSWWRSIERWPFSLSVIAEGQAEGEQLMQ